jgi:hypothetical protein
VKKIPKIYDVYVVGGKSEVPFSKLSDEDLDTILSAAISIGKKLKNDNGF